MNKEDKKEFLEDFKKVDGPKKLDMWYYALEQEVLWEQILSEMAEIAREQGVDKELDKMAEEEMKKAVKEAEGELRERYGVHCVHCRFIGSNAGTAHGNVYVFMKTNDEVKQLGEKREEIKETIEMRMKKKEVYWNAKPYSVYSLTTVKYFFDCDENGVK